MGVKSRTRSTSRGAVRLTALPPEVGKLQKVKLEKSRSPSARPACIPALCLEKTAQNSQGIDKLLRPNSESFNSAKTDDSPARILPCEEVVASLFEAGLDPTDNSWMQLFTSVCDEQGGSLMEGVPQTVLSTFLERWQ